MSSTKTLRSGEEVEILSVESNRNGVGGEPFWSIRFTLSDQTLVGIIPYSGLVFDDDYSHILGIRKADTPCFVVNPDDLTSHWRGDDISEALIEAVIEQHEKNAVLV